jgi:hypothetical protein
MVSGVPGRSWRLRPSRVSRTSSATWARRSQEKLASARARAARPSCPGAPCRPRGAGAARRCRAVRVRAQEHSGPPAVDDLGDCGRERCRGEARRSPCSRRTRGRRAPPTARAAEDAGARPDALHPVGAHEAGQPDPGPELGGPSRDLGLVRGGGPDSEARGAHDQDAGRRVLCRQRRDGVEQQLHALLGHEPPDDGERTTVVRGVRQSLRCELARMPCPSDPGWENRR